METRPFLLHALSPLHAGTGQSTGVIDLPIARMRASGLPFVPGSSIKGVLRDARKPREPDNIEERKVHAAVFGPERRDKGPKGDDASIDHAGALIVSDARLVALPVRSFFGTFALVSSPLLLHLAYRDLSEASADIPGLSGLEAITLQAGHRAVHGEGCINIPGSSNRLYLEELDLPATTDPRVTAWARVLAAALPAQEDRDLVTQRFVVVDDETMTFLWESATQVDTRVRIDDKGVVEKGALWTEESLPAESLLMGLLSARPSLRKDCERTAAQVLDTALPASGEILQLGGKATTGKGRCRMSTWSPEER
jgi:CRISPR-associated protein Cmr4